jgi:hypothetical protein
MQIPVPDVIRRIADSEDRQLAWNFFVFFSRMEYALKRSGKYLKKGTDDAQPNWNGFASDYKHNFNPEGSAELQAAVKYFQDQPPRKQLRVGDKMSWSDRQQYGGQEPLLIWLLRMICCVRNNLFHGGKFPLIPISDPSRDREVLLNSLVILEASLPLDSEVQTQFYDGIDE